MTAITTITERYAPGDEGKPAGFASGPWRTRSPVRRLLVLAMAACALLAGAGHNACAQVRVEGQSDAVHVDARDVPLQEVLEALRAKFNLRYRSNDALDGRITGTFNGPLPRITARLLDGYDYAIKITLEEIDVLVLRQHGPDDKAVAAARPALAMPRRSPAPIMTAAEANRYERGLAR
jgi:hypothetical protein